MRRGPGMPTQQKEWDPELDALGVERVHLLVVDGDLGEGAGGEDAKTADTEGLVLVDEAPDPDHAVVGVGVGTGNEPVGEALEGIGAPRSSGSSTPTMDISTPHRSIFAQGHPPPGRPSPRAPCPGRPWSGLDRELELLLGLDVLGLAGDEAVGLFRVHVREPHHGVHHAHVLRHDHVGCHRCSRTTRSRPGRSGGAATRRGCYPLACAASTDPASTEPASTDPASGGPAKPGRPPAVASLHHHGHTEGGGDRLPGEDVGHRPRSDQRRPAQQGEMGHPGRDLLQVVGDQHQRRDGQVGGQVGQMGQQPLPGPEVEPGHGFVHQQQFGVGHQGPGQQDLLALALGQQAEGPLGEDPSAEAGPVEQREGLVAVLVGVLPSRPGLQRRVATGQHHVEGGQLGPPGAGPPTR